MRYHRPASLTEAVALFDRAEDGRFLAGGQSLVPALAQRHPVPSDLIDLSLIPDLKGIGEDGGAIVLGAFTCHADVARSELLHDRLPVLSGLAQSIGDAPMRNRATLGGALADNDPAADYPGAVLGLGATVVTDRRRIAADAFFIGPFQTALERGEIIVGVRFPVPVKAAFARVPDPDTRKCLAGAFVAVFADGVRVAISGAGPTVFHVPTLDAALTRSFATRDLPDYRAHLVMVTVRRAVEACG